MKDDIVRVENENEVIDLGWEFIAENNNSIIVDSLPILLIKKDDKYALLQDDGNGNCSFLKLIMK